MRECSEVHAHSAPYAPCRDGTQFTPFIPELAPFLQKRRRLGLHDRLRKHKQKATAASPHV
jgi:hypothetical protein